MLNLTTETDPSWKLHFPSGS